MTGKSALFLTADFFKLANGKPANFPIGCKLKISRIDNYERVYNGLPAALFAGQ